MTREEVQANLRTAITIAENKGLVIPNVGLNAFAGYTPAEIVMR